MLAGINPPITLADSKIVLIVEAEEEGVVS
jgi:hypothetical protein